MKKVILDFTCAETREEIHEILKRELDLPEYYGNNLDALYDCLTDIREDTAVGIYYTIDGSPAGAYQERLRRVFSDVEEENSHLAVFFFTPYETDSE